MFSRLIYVSRLSESVDAQETRRILAASQANNPRRAVTGALIFNSGYFIQWIEGARSEISRLFARIARDDRHADVELIDFSTVAMRDFPDWSMGYVGEGVLNRALFQRYSQSSRFDPYLLSSESAVQFIREAAAASLRLSSAA
jgi:hypothetical protein